MIQKRIWNIHLVRFYFTNWYFIKSTSKGIRSKFSRSYVSPHAISCDQAQLLSSLQYATVIFERSIKNSTNSTGPAENLDDVCFALYANICQPYFSAACRNGQSVITAIGAQTVATTAPETELLRPSALETWGIGLLFICLVCSCAAFGVCFYPIMKTKFFHFVITWMIGLAVGSLSGIAIFQLIPQAFELGNV